MVSVPEGAATAVIPSPAIVPRVQLNAPLIVSVPLPPSVPPLSVPPPTVTGTLKMALPLPLTFSVPATTVSGLLKVALPPLTVVVPATLYVPATVPVAPLTLDPPARSPVPPAKDRLAPVATLNVPPVPPQAPRDNPPVLTLTMPAL